MQLQLTATPDADAPELTLPTEALHPLDGSAAEASEALLDAHASLTAVDGSARNLEPSHGAAKPAFFVEIPPLLSFGSTYRWHATATDFAGNQLLSRGQLSTLADPGILPQDGFESAVPALGDTPAPVVAEGAISGAHSLRVEPNERSTFHLHRVGSHRLAFQFQPLAVDATPEEAEYSRKLVLQVRYGTLGATRVVSKSLDAESAAAFSGASSSQSIQLDLPEPGDDVIVSFNLLPEDESCWFGSCVVVPSLIDDLRLE